MAKSLEEQIDDLQTPEGNGRIVDEFTLTVHNLGLARVGRELLGMLKTKHWMNFQLGDHHYRFLPGEFDYFLTARGITRKQVMALNDVAVKAELETAMDERRTGNTGYRRTITQARAENPTGINPIEPFGYSQKEAKALVAMGTTVRGRDRASLGNAVRRYANNGTTKAPAECKPRWERVARTVANLGDDDFNRAYEAIKNEAARRRKTRG